MARGVPAARGPSPGSQIDMFIASRDVMHLCQGVRTLPSAVATHSAVVTELKVQGGELLAEWVRPKAPKLVRQTGPLLEVQPCGVASVAKRLIEEGSLGQPPVVGGLRDVPGIQVWIDVLWDRWLALARRELEAYGGQELKHFGEQYEFREVPQDRWRQWLGGGPQPRCILDLA